MDIICAGINHQTWYLSVKYNGKELLDQILPAYEVDEMLIAQSEWFPQYQKEIELAKNA